MRAVTNTTDVPATVAPGEGADVGATVEPGVDDARRGLAQYQQRVGVLVQPGVRHPFPAGEHWWFGDAWTGPVRIWRPDVVEHDPESGGPMLTGWMGFGISRAPDTPDTSDASVDASVLPWTVVL